jgi:glycosyltransferase involved in cell wall biosynthesis
MSLGKSVVSYVIEEVKEEFYPDCPIFNANIDNLANRLEELIMDRELRHKLGVLGIEFVRNNLYKHKINKRLLEIYADLPR